MTNEHNPLPEAPLKLLWALQMDFSNMHPDEWARTDAARWNEYIQYRIAYEDGREEVKHRRGNEANAKKNMASLIERATGKRS